MSEPQPEQPGASPSAAPEASPAPWHYATPDGATVGPVTDEALAAAVADGRIAPDTAVWRAEYGDQWRAAGTVPELIPSWRIAEAARITVVERDTALDVAPPARAFAEALGFVAAALFRPFSILAWLSLALCRLMASSRMMAGPGNSASPPVFSTGAAPTTTLVALFNYLREGVAAIFLPHISIVWLATVILYGLFTAYIAAKGRLLFVGKACFPQEPLPRLWRRTIGRTASLWRLYYSLDVLLNLACYWFVFRFFTSSGLIASAPDAETLSEALASPAVLWLSAAALLFTAVELVRTLVFHFAEPLVFLLGIPVGTAARMVGRTLRSTAGALPRLLGFFAIVLACRAVYFTLVFAAALIIPPALLLPVAIIVLLPFDFLIRAFGTRFIYVKCENSQNDVKL